MKTALSLILVLTSFAVYADLFQIACDNDKKLIEELDNTKSEVTLTGEDSEWTFALKAVTQKKAVIKDLPNWKWKVTNAGKTYLFDISSCDFTSEDGVLNIYGSGKKLEKTLPCSCATM